MKKKSGNILIVDDERNSREALCGFLQAGYNVTVAEDGLRAINILKKRDFDVVLTDLRMPGVDGMAVLKETCVKVSPCQMHHPDRVWLG